MLATRARDRAERRGGQASPRVHYRGDEMTVEPANDGFGELMTKVERERGFACASYKDKCLRRRVSLRMKAVGVESFVDYSMFLDGDAAEYDKLVDSLTINVTRFFRN